MEHAIFKIVKQDPIDIIMSEQTMKDFPCHEMYMVEASEFLLMFKYLPLPKTIREKDAFIKRVTNHIKVKYRGYSVEYMGKLQEQLNSKQPTP